MAKRYAICKLCSHAHSSREPHVLIGGPEPSKDVKRLAAVASTVERVLRKDEAGGSNPPRGSNSVVAVEIPQTVDDVRRLVTEINADVGRLYDDMDRIGKRLLIIHDTNLWREMGYATWEGFIAGEIKLSRRHANRQLSHQRFLALLPGPSSHASARDPSTLGADINGTTGPTPTEGQTREIRSDPVATARVRRMVAQGKSPREAVETVNRSVDFGPRTVNAACQHPRKVCADCGRRLE